MNVPKKIYPFSCLWVWKFQRLHFCNQGEPSDLSTMVLSGETCAPLCLLTQDTLRINEYLSGSYPRYVERSGQVFHSDSTATTKHETDNVYNGHFLLILLKDELLIYFLTNDF